MKDGSEYEVGYGKPPKGTRWKKGQSGNPSGKKKPSAKAPPTYFLECLAEEFSEPVEMTVRGKKAKIPFGKAFTKKFLHDLMAAPAKEKIKAIEMLQKIGIFNIQKALDDGTVEDPFTEEDRRLLAAILDESE